MGHPAGDGRLSLSDIAGRLERAFPQFDTASVARSIFSIPIPPGSDVMKQRVVEQATSLARHHQPQ